MVDAFYPFALDAHKRVPYRKTHLTREKQGTNNACFKLLLNPSISTYRLDF